MVQPFEKLTDCFAPDYSACLPMYIVPIAWLYVAVMMAVAEATNTTGTVLGGIITFLLYGLLPVGLVVYVMGAPTRRRAIKAKEHAELEAARAASALEPDASSQATRDPIAAERIKP
jgi:hypothetical protein